VDFKSYAAITCSRKCMGLLHAKKNSVICVCKTCTKEFRIKRSEKDEGRGVYCSSKCYRDREPTAFDTTLVLSMWETGLSAGAIGRKVGHSNGQTVARYLRRIGIFEIRHATKEKCRTWKGGVTYRGATADRIRERAGNKCERCKWNEEPGVLQIHHVDRNRRHNGDENLILLCPNCHEVDHFKAGDGRY